MQKNYSRIKNPKSLKILSELENLSSVRNFIKTYLSENKIDDNIINDVEFAVDEAVTNIIKHSYKNTKNFIIINIILLKKYIRIKIFDYGPPFDPLKYQDIDINKKLYEGKSHGYGIYSIKKFTDMIKYKRLKNRNLLILYKKYK